jgi:ATP phosphoribosyltransferase regulatory subunit
VENRGFEYHTGVGFTIFSRGERGEIGSGGRYTATLNGLDHGTDNGEAATGFTLYVDTIMRALPGQNAPSRLYIPYGASADADLMKLQEAGWVTISGLDGDVDAAADALRLGCSHIWVSGVTQPLKQE